MINNLATQNQINSINENLVKHKTYHLTSGDTGFSELSDLPISQYDVQSVSSSGVICFPCNLGGANWYVKSCIAASLAPAANRTADYEVTYIKR